MSEQNAWTDEEVVDMVTVAHRVNRDQNPKNKGNTPSGNTLPRSWCKRGSGEKTRPSSGRSSSS
jgi:hypothetical protein